MALRTFALFIVLVAGCGDDGGASSPPDLACSCCHNSGDACTTQGDHCSGFEWSCTCGSDGTWSCRGGYVPPHDMAHPSID